jgi:hypothetical protein
MPGIKILNPAGTQQEIGQSGGNAANAVIVLGRYAAPALVFINAAGSASYNGPTANAGILLSITVGDVTVYDDSFEGESSSIHFRSSASHVFILPKDNNTTVEAKVEHMGAGGVNNKNTQVRLTCFAVAIE